MGLDINILSIPRRMATAPTDAYVGSPYENKPRWQQAAHFGHAWGLQKALSAMYAQRGGKQDCFNDTTVRLYKRDIKRLFANFPHDKMLAHIDKGRVVYAHVSF